MYYEPSTNTEYSGNERIVDSEGTQYGTSIFKNESLLNSKGIYRIQYGIPNEDYYTQGALTKTLVGNVYEFNYAAVDRPLADVKSEAKLRAFYEMRALITVADELQKPVDRLAAYGLSSYENNIATYKKDVYEKHAQRMRDIDACTTVAQIETLEQSPVVVTPPTPTWDTDIETALHSTVEAMTDASGVTEYATLADLAAATSSATVNTTQQDFYRQAVTDMNDALALTDNFIYRESEYKKILPPRITGTGQTNQFVFNLTDLYKDAKGWREDIIQTTVSRFNAIKAGADATAWQAALDDNVFATPTEDAIAQLIDAINNQGDFRTTSDTSEYNGAPVVNSVYAYRLEMIGIVTQQLCQFWMDEQANSTLYREAERIKIGNTNSSYMHEQIIGNPQYETWYKNVVDQFSDKMQAIYDATTYEQADTAFATAINYDGPYPADKRPMPITWTDKTVGWGRRTAETTDPYNALQSARNKLIALGLTDNEALALCYYEGDDSRMLGEWT